MKKSETALRRTLGRDYARDLRRKIVYRDLLTLLEEARRTWPRFNSELVGPWSTHDMEVAAAGLGIHLEAAPFEGREGLALRGFYLHRAEPMLKRPLIYVNTAHHPIAAGATFCHEIGHHLALGILPGRPEEVRFFVADDYASHLDDPVELAADITVSLASYPASLARRLFGQGTEMRGLVVRTRDLADETFDRVRKHFEQYPGLDFAATKPADRALRYVTGLVHYAKLRWALLAEYEI